jgi:hypothetical protein
MDEIIFFAGATLFLLAVIVFWVGWSANEKASRQQDILSEWEEDLNEWANAQQKNIADLHQQNLDLQTAQEAERTAVAEARRELEAAQQQAQTHALAVQNYTTELSRMEQEIRRLQTERDKIRADFAKLVDFLVEVGVLRKPVDSLPASSEELREFYIQPADTATSSHAANANLPDVSGLTPEQLRMALQHAAKRAFSEHVKANTPFSKTYMVTLGPLTLSQFEALRAALTEQGYLKADASRFKYELTPEGRALLRGIKDGML